MTNNNLNINMVSSSSDNVLLSYNMFLFFLFVIFVNRNLKCILIYYN